MLLCARTGCICERSAYNQVSTLAGAGGAGGVAGDSLGKIVMSDCILFSSFDLAFAMRSSAVDLMIPR